MSGLDQLLDAYAPPPVPEGLARRSAAAAAVLPQEARAVPTWRRMARRTGWRRGTLVGGAALSLALTSAVAAEVVSGGRIELPVAHQIVEAIPALKEQASSHVERPRVAVRRPSTRAPDKALPVEAAVTSDSAQPAVALRREQLMQRFRTMRQRVDEKRAQGLPTPHADRIEARAKRAIKQRQERGFPTPSLEEVEMRMAMREVRVAQMLRRVPADPAAISDAQVARFARLLPPRRRAQFLSLSPQMQRQLMVRFAQRQRLRRARQQVLTPPQQP